MDAFSILASLQAKKNVLLMGAPGTGKSKLMNDVARTFEAAASATATPAHQPGAAIPIPAVPAVNTAIITIAWNTAANPLSATPSASVIR